MSVQMMQLCLVAPSPWRAALADPRAAPRILTSESRLLRFSFIILLMATSWWIFAITLVPLRVWWRVGGLAETELREESEVPRRGAAALITGRMPLWSLCLRP